MNAVQGVPDAELGGNVFKFRLARASAGASGGARAIVAMRAGSRVVLMYGFEKKDLANIKSDELKTFRKAASVYLSYSEAEMTSFVEAGALIELLPGKGGKHG